MAVFKGRYSGTLEGDFVVFMIGMRVNKPWKVHRWFPVFLQMPRMLRELQRQPDSGLLGATQGFLSTGPVVVQYWRSFEQLERYARDPNAEHLPAWRRFIYGNMPRIGLARVGEHQTLGSTSTAALRSGTRAEDEAPVTGY
jgi:Monooxygenase af470-like